MNIDGMTFGRLLVVRQINSYYSLCRCSCGESKEILTTSLTRKSGSSKSCGCIQREMMQNKPRFVASRELLKAGRWKCPKCKETKDLKTGFYRSKPSRTGYASHCIVCQNDNRHLYEDKDKRHLVYIKYRNIHRDQVLRRKFGISLDEYNIMVLKQDGKCAICGGVNSNRNLAVDHNHATGQVRGLLCSRC